MRSYGPPQHYDFDTVGVTSGETSSDARFRALLSSTWDIITVHDGEGRYLYCNPSVTPQLGFTPNELIGAHPLDFIHPDDASFARTALAEVSVGGDGFTAAAEYRVRHKNGEWMWMESVGRNKLADPGVRGIVITSRNITDRHQAQERLRRRAAQAEAVARLGTEALARNSGKHLLGRAVNVVRGVLGVDHCAVVTLEPSGRLRVDARTNPSGPAAPPVVLGALAVGGRSSVVMDADAKAGVDHRVPVLPELAQAGFHAGGAAPIAGQGPSYGALVAYSRTPGVFSADDASFLESVANVLAAAIERQRAYEELRRRALHDSLTGLPNRELLLRRMADALRRMRARAGGSLAVLFIDNDDLKVVNDSLGHAAGDLVVAEMAERIVAGARRADTVARFGGDEFVVLCTGTTVAEARELADRLRVRLAEPVDCAGRAVVVTASIGMAVTTRGDTSPDDLLAAADIAMYVAKRAGKDRVALFADPMRHRVTHVLEVASSLRRALTRDELQVHYQPVFATESREMVGAEGLVRWMTPDQGQLEPEEFVDVAEESGLVVPLGRRVLDQACRQARRWSADGHDLFVAVNLSGRQLAEPDIVDTVGRILDQTGVEPGRICLELTESAVVSDLDRAGHVVERLRAFGVLIGLDDFGTGYSSLSYLADLPFDFVKIDRSFTARVGDDRAEALLATIANLCRSLELSAVAEGIETEDQLQRMRALGIPFVQGFLLGRPVPSEDFAFDTRR